MKKNNSSKNLALAIFLLVTSIMAIFGMAISHIASFLIRELNYLTQSFNQGDYIFYLFAWVMLHSYMIILAIEWLGEKSVKHDLTTTLSLMIAAGVWGIIRGEAAIGIAVLILYGLIYYYIKKTPSKKLLIK